MAANLLLQWCITYIVVWHTVYWKLKIITSVRLTERVWVSHDFAVGKWEYYQYFYHNYLLPAQIPASIYSSMQRSVYSLRLPKLKIRDRFEELNMQIDDPVLFLTACQSQIPTDDKHQENKNQWNLARWKTRGRGTGSRGVENAGCGKRGV